MKKVLSVLIVAVMLIGMLPAIAIPAFAATSGITGDCTWTLNGTELTISGNGAMGDYHFYPGSTAPWGESITKVTIENSVTTIGYYAFYNCKSLTSLTIPDSVNTIGEGAFSWCTGLTSVTIPDSIISIGDDAFHWCDGLTSIYIFDVAKWCAIDFKSSLSNPLYYAEKLYLNGELITDLVIPKGVASIPKYAFSCKNITSITIPDSVTTIGDYAFDNCKSLISLTIPDGVTSIGSYAFVDCTGLTSVTIPNSVITIGESAFYNCAGLTSITIPDSVTSIGTSAFGSCSGLTSVTISDGVSSFGEIFPYCIGLTSVTISGGATSVGEEVFDGCSGLTSITILDGVTAIGMGAFRGCSGLTSITIPESVTSIGASAFSGCTGLTSVTIPNRVTYIGVYAFSGCRGLTSITIPDSVISIEDHTFRNCISLTSLTIPDSVTSIGYRAFYYCYSLTSVTIPNSVTSIEEFAFESCSGLKEVELLASVNNIPSNAFNGCNKIRRVYLPAELYLVYSSTFHFQPIQRVFFGGTQAQYEAMIIQHTNDGLVNAKWSYNEIGLPDHTYTNVCDKDCNECGMTRVTEHKYDNDCDTKCNLCGTSRTTTHKFGSYVYNNDATSQKDGTKTRTCSVCRKAETVTVAGTKLQNPFKDVKTNEYYAEPVFWAVGKNITNGMTVNTFAPNNDCTRGQIVTFLWRAAGSPEPKNTRNPFKDVKSNQYYYKAVLWAVEKGITNGTSANTFSPDATCTRAQVVTFLWRAKGSPKGSATNPFKDVKKSYYSDAVLWAVKNNITTGTSATTFSPDATCTRGQIVTFLYRAYK